MSSGLPVSFTLVMVFVFAIVGFFAGRYVSLMVYKRKFAEKEALLRASISTGGSGSSPALIPPVDQPIPLADQTKYIELLRLWKEKETGKMFVETSGHLLASSAPLNPSQKKRFIDLIKELAIWTGIPANEVPPAAIEPVSKPASFPAATIPNGVQPTFDKPTMVSAGTQVKTNPLPAAVPESSLPTPPPPTPISAIGTQSIAPPVPYKALTPVPASKPISEPTKKPAASMVEQIDEILQEIIQRSDNPARRIKLVEERNQGVIVWVGQDHFNGIDAVTDDSARELIRAAAKEWERRAESHL